VDLVPDPANHFDEDPDADPYPDLNLMLIWIQIRMRIQVTKMIRIHNTESGLILVGGDPVDERVLLPGPADLLPHLPAERLPRRQLEQEAGGIQHLQARQRETNTPVRT
jgi:hypothetical protein